MASRRSESPLGSSPAAAALQRELRRRLHWHLYDESGVTPAGAAIYSLADPREVRISRYVGQTAQPARRLAIGAHQAQADEHERELGRGQ